MNEVNELVEPQFDNETIQYDNPDIAEMIVINQIIVTQILELNNMSKIYTSFRY